jgi:hypothetical protein
MALAVACFPAISSAKNVVDLDAHAHPYVASVVRSFPAGLIHKLSAQAFISEKHGKHASRTLHVAFTACS